jgi:hypothetical protein
MRFASAVALITLFSAPAFCADLVITKAKHADAVKMPGNEQPATDTTEVTWFGKDRMRSEEGDRVTIVRVDQKKMYMLDTKAKTVSTIDLPFDMKKYIPAEMAPMMEQMMGQMKVTITPTTETKKIKDWNATKHTMTMALPMGGSMTQDIWATKEIEFDRAAFGELSSAMMSTAMGGASMAAEYKKIEGIPVLMERTQTIMGSTSKSREEVKSVETKEAPEGIYDVPKGYTEKPFDPMSEGGMGGRGSAGKPRGGPPSEKPKQKS